MWLFWTELAFACLLGIAGIYSVIYASAVAWLLLLSFSIFAGIAVSEWLKLHGHSRRVRRIFSIATGLLLLISSILLGRFLPSDAVLENKNPSQDSPLRITQTLPYPYETGKEARVDIRLENRSVKEVKYRGVGWAIVKTKMDPLRSPALEEAMWSQIMEKATHSSFPNPESVVPPLSNDNRVVLLGPLITNEQEKELREGKTAALYFMGLFTYEDSNGGFHRIEFCGFYRDDPRVMFACRAHSDSLRSLMR